MVFKGLIAATAAVALAATPAIAASKSARLAPASETLSGSQQGEMDGSGTIVAILAALAVIGGILAATSGGNGTDTGFSPT